MRKENIKYSLGGWDTSTDYQSNYENNSIPLLNSDTCVYVTETVEKKRLAYFKERTSQGGWDTYCPTNLWAPIERYGAIPTFSEEFNKEFAKRMQEYDKRMMEIEARKLVEDMNCLCAVSEGRQDDTDQDGEETDY
mmetsp:Transcript_13949/g.26252  ORF Transcript_13949/g.26252 Transcript_13949/m.26252 type:complete len:136 (+) Transcript_13949:84-491(+)